MNVWTALILGLLVGWIVEWVIDWIYWRRRTQSSTAELENLRAQNSRLRADLEVGAGSINKLKADLAAATGGMAAAKADSDRMRAEIDASIGSLDQIKADLAAANTSLATLRAENEQLRSQLEAANGSLEQYKGELGTLDANLSAAQADRDRLRIELDALRAERAPTQVELGVAQGSRDQYKTQLLSIDPALATGAAAGVHLSDTGERPDNSEAERLRAELAGANGEIERLRAQLAAPHTIVAQRARDQLIDINGISPAYEQRLFDAGIYTFEDLAAQTPDRLRELVGAKAWQEADTEAWIAEARQMAKKHERTLAIGQPRHDPLIDINGIGPAYEQRLFEAGIYTFDDLAAQTPARLRELVGAKAWQEADTEAWIAEARQMAQAAKERSAQ